MHTIDRVHPRTKEEKIFVFVRIFFFDFHAHAGTSTQNKTNRFLHTYTTIDYDDEASGEKTVLLDFVVSEKRFFFFFFFFFFSELLLE